MPAVRAPCGASYKLGGHLFSTNGVPTLDVNIYLHGAGPVDGASIPSPYTVVICNNDYGTTTEVWNWNVSAHPGNCLPSWPA